MKVELSSRSWQSLWLRQERAATLREDWDGVCAFPMRTDDRSQTSSGFREGGEMRVYGEDSVDVVWQRWFQVTLPSPAAAPCQIQSSCSKAVVYALAGGAATF